VGVGVNITQIESMIMVSDQVQINFGEMNSETITFYNPALIYPHSVPSYYTMQTILASSTNNTKFDGYGTRFINNRVSFEDPEVGDSWLIFPNTGALL
jgi:hypothetical protein